MSWFKKLFSKKSGVFVSVNLDYGFGDILEGYEKADKGPFPHTLFIDDLNVEDAKSRIEGRRFDWHKIDSHWRHNLEIKGFHAAKWADVKSYLRSN